VLLNPFITAGWRWKSGVEFTIPRTLTMRLTRSSEPSESRHGGEHTECDIASGCSSLFFGEIRTDASHDHFSICSPRHLATDIGDAVNDHNGCVDATWGRRGWKRDGKFGESGFWFHGVAFLLSAAEIGAEFLSVVEVDVFDIAGRAIGIDVEENSQAPGHGARDRDFLAQSSGTKFIPMALAASAGKAELRSEVVVKTAEMTSSKSAI
jgi:hypothetical protein